MIKYGKRRISEPCVAVGADCVGFHGATDEAAARTASVKDRESLNATAPGAKRSRVSEIDSAGAVSAPSRMTFGSALLGGRTRPFGVTTMAAVTSVANSGGKTGSGTCKSSSSGSGAGTSGSSSAPLVQSVLAFRLRGVLSSTCPRCGMVFAPGLREDDEAHAAHCARAAAAAAAEVSLPAKCLQPYRIAALWSPATTSAGAGWSGVRPAAPASGLAKLLASAAVYCLQAASDPLAAAGALVDVGAGLAPTVAGSKCEHASRAALPAAVRAVLQRVAELLRDELGVRSHPFPPCAASTAAAPLETSAGAGISGAGAAPAAWEGIAAADAGTGTGTGVDAGAAQSPRKDVRYWLACCSEGPSSAAGSASSAISGSSSSPSSQMRLCGVLVTCSVRRAYPLVQQAISASISPATLTAADGDGDGDAVPAAAASSVASAAAGSFCTPKKGKMAFPASTGIDSSCIGAVPGESASDYTANAYAEDLVAASVSGALAGPGSGSVTSAAGAVPGSSPSPAGAADTDTPTDDGSAAEAGASTAALRVDRRHPVPASLGVCQLWVAPRFRRSGVGAALLDAARAHAVYGSGAALPVSAVAFSQPTRAGLAFARAYVRAGAAAGRGSADAEARVLVF